jgi:hypothetical protein
MVGMVILWGLRKNSAAWEGGHILDPTSGRIYRVTLKLADGARSCACMRSLGSPCWGAPKPGCACRNPRSSL